MWTTVEELHQTENSERVSKTIQNISSESLARSIKRNKEIKNKIGKNLLFWSQIKRYQNLLQIILNSI